MNFNFWSLCLLYPNNWTDFQCHPALAKSPFLDWSRLTLDSNVDSTLRPEGWVPRCRTWYTWFVRCLNRTWRSRFARSTFCYRRLRTMPKSCHPDRRPKLWRGLDERWSFAFCSPLAFHTLPSVPGFDPDRNPVTLDTMWDLREETNGIEDFAQASRFQVVMIDAV